MVSSGFKILENLPEDPKVQQEIGLLILQESTKQQIQRNQNIFRKEIVERDQLIAALRKENEDLQKKVITQDKELETLRVDKQYLLEQELKLKQDAFDKTFQSQDIDMANRDQTTLQSDDIDRYKYSINSNSPVEPDEPKPLQSNVSEPNPYENLENQIVRSQNDKKSQNSDDNNKEILTQSTLGNFPVGAPDAKNLDDSNYRAHLENLKQQNIKIQEGDKRSSQEKCDVKVQDSSSSLQGSGGKSSKKSKGLLTQAQNGSSGGAQREGKTGTKTMNPFQQVQGISEEIRDGISFSFPDNFSQNQGRVNNGMHKDVRLTNSYAKSPQDPNYSLNLRHFNYSADKNNNNSYPSSLNSNHQQNSHRSNSGLVDTQFLDSQNFDNTPRQKIPEKKQQQYYRSKAPSTQTQNYSASFIQRLETDNSYRHKKLTTGHTVPHKQANNQQHSFQNSQNSNQTFFDPLTSQQSIGQSQAHVSKSNSKKLMTNQRPSQNGNGFSNMQRKIGQMIHPSKKSGEKMDRKHSIKTSEPQKIEGRDLFKQIRLRLNKQQFNIFMGLIKEYNSKKISKDEILISSRDVFGVTNEDLHTQFDLFLKQNPQYT